MLFPVFSPQHNYFVKKIVKWPRHFEAYFFIEDLLSEVKLSVNSLVERQRILHFHNSALVKDVSPFALEVEA